MKTKILLVASFILAIGMTGCSNSMDDETPLPSTKSEDVLIVKLPGNFKSTRAVEDQVDGTPAGVDDVTVFLLAGQSVEKAETLLKADIDKQYKRFEQVPSQVNRVIVVANINDMPVENLKNANAILNYAYTIPSQYGKTGLAGKTLIGEAEVVDASTAPEASEHPDHKYKEAIVNLKAITARIEVGTVVAGVGVEKVELVSVYVNNFFDKYRTTNVPVFYNEDSSMWNYEIVGNDPGANIGSATEIGTITPNKPVLFDPSQYQINASAEVKQEVGSKVYAFHVFPGNIPHVIMLVKLELADGFYEVDENDSNIKYKYKYGFVTFSKFKISENNYVPAMEGHNVYKMGVGATGIPINAKDITDKPEKGPYDLGVTIKIEPWGIHHVTPEV